MIDAPTVSCCAMNTRSVVTLIVARENPSSLAHSTRTAIAAVVSLLAARVLHLPEAYWASITALIVMQSTFGAALSISAQRFVGTAVGAVLGAAAATYVHGNVIVYGVLVFLIGLLCSVLHVERTAYRYATITLAIIMLIPRAMPPWMTAAHRFIEVSLGIIVALAITAVWPEQQTVTKSVTTKAAP